MLCTKDGFVDSLRPPKRWPRSFAEMSKGNHPKIAISAFDGFGKRPKYSTLQKTNMATEDPDFPLPDLITGW